MTGAQQRHVVLMSSDELERAADCLPSNLGRASFVSRLIRCMPGLLSALEIVEPEPSTAKQLRAFHSERLVSRLLHQETQESEDSDSASESEDERPPRKKRRKDLLEHDTRDFIELPDYVRLVAGASIDAARLLRERKADVAISWNGGRHHASADKPSGFCYVSDIALAILELRKPCKGGRLDRILYLDLDVHHGDGVAQAFYTSSNVLTLSVHHHAPGFFPTSGPLDETGPAEPSKAAFHCLNVAVPKTGFSDAGLERLFGSSVEPVKVAFEPHAIVVCLGLDGIAGDPVNAFNYSLRGLLRALESVLAWKLPTLLLGGGGYENTQCARAWAAATMLVAGLGSIDDILKTSIPEDCDDLPEYGEPYTLDISAGLRKDENTEQDLQRIEEAFVGYAEKLRKQRAPDREPCVKAIVVT